MSWTYLDARQALDDRINLEAVAAGGGDRPGPNIDRMRRFMHLMADPQDAVPVVHLTGTNGKTSTARILTSLLRAKGLSVGTYTSPDLGRVNDRIRHNDEPIPDAAFAAMVGAVVDLELSMGGERLTWFETLTAAAYRWFADLPVDVAVVEVGMLGRWDATNVADGTVAVVTNVGLDHMAYAGPTRLHIAREKAGIVKPGSRLVLGETDPELAQPFEEQGAAEILRRDDDWGVSDNRLALGGRVLDLYTPGASYPGVFLPIHGAHQGDNAAAALAAAEAFFGEPVSEEVLHEGFAEATSPGRLEVVGRQPLVVLDGAHNVAGAEALAAALDDEFDVAGDVILVVGALKGHDLDGMIEVLAGAEPARVVACAPDWPRAHPARVVAELFRRRDVPVAEADTVAAAVDLALASASTDDLVLVTGSLYTVGEARRLFR